MSEPEHEQRVAVVFIHGQGQQRPMEDVQELARTVWEADGRGRTWTAPDARLGMADLQRITTEAGKSPPRVDFFEHYWAHYMAGNRLEHFVSWFRELMARPRREAPRNLLPVRQWVVRFMESITLLCVLFSLGVSLLLPPPPDGISSDSLRNAFLGLPVPTPTDVTYILMLAAVGLIVAAAVVMIVHEITGGVPKPRPKPTLFGLKAKATSLSSALPLAMGLGFAVTVAIVSMLIFQGPQLQWGDLRLPLTLVTALAALSLTMRWLNTAVTLAMGASVVALVIAVFGEISAENLWKYESANDPGALSGWTQTIKTFLHCETPGQVCFDAGKYALHIFFGLFSFAFLWSAFGVHVGIGAARQWWVRLFWTAVIVAVSAAVAYWHLSSLYAYDITNELEREQLQASWALYASGVTLAIVTLAGILVARVAARAFLIPVMTDSARYFSRNPEHIDARQQIREAGIKLLDKLHDPEAKYQRIIIVAHSLGTAVGYELLMDYWARQSGAYVLDDNPNVAAALRDVENAARTLNGCGDEDACDRARIQFRIAQRRLSRLLTTMTLKKNSHGHPEGKHWLISDFITLGSPLTHASLLLADSRADLAEKQATRKIAACPPTLHTPDGALDLCNGDLTFVGWDKKTRPVHSALFAAVRWTNHYFKTESWIVVGDVIGGPIATPADYKKARKGPERGDLGRGVLDVSVDRLGAGKLFAHNEYWRSALSTEELARHLKAEKPRPDHIVKLIEAIDFDDKSPP